MALPGLFCLVQVGAHFLEAVVRRFDNVYRSGREGKECDNLLTIIAHLYNFHVVQACLIFDVLRKLVGTFTEKDIELILLMLRNVGFSLRKDDALSLKELITETQARASEAGGRFRDQTRVRASCFLTACAPVGQAWAKASLPRPFSSALSPWPLLPHLCPWLSSGWESALFLYSCEFKNHSSQRSAIGRLTRRALGLGGHLLGPLALPPLSSKGTESVPRFLRLEDGAERTPCLDCCPAA